MKQYGGDGMDTLQAIKERKSVRKFTEQQVTRDDLVSLVEAGTEAPSASNLQAWRFIIVDEPALIRKVKMFSPGLGGLPSAIIAVCSDYDYAEKRGTGPNYKTYGCIMDASMAAQNIMLAAVDKGLGTCAIKSYDEKAVRKILSLPEPIHLELLITVGYAEGETRKAPRRNQNVLMHFNGWKEKI